MLLSLSVTIIANCISFAPMTYQMTKSDAKCML